jgi:hypothetical protein
MKKEKAKLIHNISDLNLCDKFDRIYFGDEFCENKMPNLYNLKFLQRNIINKKITVVFPYITQSNFKKISGMVKFISKNGLKFDEIAFNDWGIFYFIRQHYPNLKLVLGRLLTKQKTDPFANDIILNQQEIVSSKQKVFVPKKISADTLEYFSQSLINSLTFQKFMVENNIIRVELDNLNWDMNIKLPKDIKISIYFPYIKISTTRYCGQLNMLKNNCSKQCEKSNIILKKYRTKFNYIIKGNAVFFKNTKISNAILADRIVYND